MKTSPEVTSATDQLPIVIYDYRVMAWLIYGTMANNQMLTPEELILNKYASVRSLDIKKYTPSQLEQLASSLTKIERQQLADQETQKYAKACWSMVLNRGPNCIDYEPHVAIIVDDNGGTLPYWRKQIYPAYKGNRSQKPDLVLSVGQLGLQYISQPNSPFHYFSVPGYEADDIAGALVYIKRLNQQLGGNPLIANRELRLYTVDSDWLQLVGNGVTWYNSGPWAPRVRGHFEACEWALKRLKVNISHPGQIVDTKMIQGDKSDNLPKGTPRHMIDLMVGHPKYHLRHNPQVWLQLHQVYQYSTCNQIMAHYEAAKRWIWSRGYKLPV